MRIASYRIKRLTLLMLLLPVFVIASAEIATHLVQPEILKLSARMKLRTLAKGVSTTITADVFYSAEGKLVTHFLTPREYILIQNALGEMKLYDPAENTVMVDQSIMYSSETSHFYYLFSNEYGNMGLSKMGFVKSETRFEDEMVITRWSPPEALAEISFIELVTERGQPIYLGYTSKDNLTVKKIYFTQYMQFGAVGFPTMITEINFLSATDSSIARTNYYDFAINQEVDDYYLKFQVPPTATLE